MGIEFQHPYLDVATSQELSTLVDPTILRSATDWLCNSNGSDLNTYLKLMAKFPTVNDAATFLPEYTQANLAKLSCSIAQNPTAGLQTIAKITEISLNEVQLLSPNLQQSPILQNALLSHYYPAYLLTRYAQSFYTDLKNDPDYLNRVGQQQIIAPKRLEIHPTNATCNYRCAMCLWHVKNQANYHISDETQLLTVQDWNNLLKEAYNLGTRVIIISGGGEPLLRSDIANIINYAKEIGLTTMIYTNGSLLYKLDDSSPLYQALLNSDWLRISMHATNDDRYAKLVQLPVTQKPFTKVKLGIERLVQDRNRFNKPLQLGIGYVIQSLNFDQVLAMTKLASNIGLDFLNLREDCIDITEKLTPDQKLELYRQLNIVRKTYEDHQFKNLQIDFADSLIAPMNDWTKTPNINKAEQCRVHLYRSAVDPFGRVAVCDIAAEPFFQMDELTLGYLTDNISYKQVLTEAAGKQFFPNLCQNCMPGQVAINALWEKTLKDYHLGIRPEDQPLFFQSII